MRFWDKARACDVFVLLGQCQFEKGKYQNRFHIGSEWFTMSVKHGMAPIVEKQYANPNQDWERIKFRLMQHPFLSEFDNCISDSLWETNRKIILQAASTLSPKTRFEMDFPTCRTKTARLVQICQHYGADTYLAGVSGGGYMDLTLFEQAGIKVIFQDHEKVDKRAMVKAWSAKLCEEGGK